MNLKEIEQNIVTDKKFRINLTQEDFAWFFTTYFSDYIGYKIAPLHKQMFKIITDSDKSLSVFVTFRGSGKSTILSLAYPIWSILGKPGKKHIIICSYTQPQAKLILENIKSELEKNELLIHDYGKFQYSDDLWRSDTLVLPKYNARISIASVGTSIRGVRHGKYRPDLIILDDAESLESIETLEGRDRVMHWLERDLIPAGDKDTHIIVLGNLLHNDDLINRLIKRVDNEQLSGDYMRVPLIDDNGKITWKGKYPDMTAINREKLRVGDDRAFRREYLLQIIPEDEQIITEDMISYYDELPEDHYREAGILTVDLAISKKESADNTAMLAGYVYRIKDKQYLYILPVLVNTKLNFHEAVDKAEEFAKSMDTGEATYIYSETVGYQSAFIEDLLRDNFNNAEGFEIMGNDKRSRLSTTVHPLSQGRVLFPKKGLDLLKTQLFGFGVEKHDDLADAFSMLVMKGLSNKFGCGDVIAVPFIDGRERLLPSCDDDYGYRRGGFPRFSIQFPS